MQPDLRADYQRIGEERDAAGAIADREKLWFFVRLGAFCWAWVAVGGVMMARGLHINATIGPFYFPGLMDRAEMWFNSGLFVGTAGPLMTLIFGLRRATHRGLLD